MGRRQMWMCKEGFRQQKNNNEHGEWLSKWLKVVGIGLAVAAISASILR